MVDQFDDFVENDLDWWNSHSMLQHMHHAVCDSSHPTVGWPEKPPWNGWLRVGLLMQTSHRQRAGILDFITFIIFSCFVGILWYFFYTNEHSCKENILLLWKKWNVNKWQWSWNVYWLSSASHSSISIYMSNESDFITLFTFSPLFHQDCILNHLVYNGMLVIGSLQECHMTAASTSGLLFNRWFCMFIQLVLNVWINWHLAWHACPVHDNNLWNYQQAYGTIVHVYRHASATFIHYDLAWHTH